MLKNPTFDQAMNSLHEDASSSEWLKRAAAWASQRDPVDALNDAEALLELMQLRFQELQAGFSEAVVTRPHQRLLPDLSLG